MNNEVDNNYGNDYIDPVRTGKFICELRKSHNMTQEELGEKVFITRKAVSKWENGKCCPSIDVMKRLCKVLGVTFDELTDGKFKEPDPSDNERSMNLLSKMFYNSLFKTIIGFIIALIVLCLLIFFFENYNSTQIYTISYEDDNFSITNSTIVFSKAKEYFNLGDFDSNLLDADENTVYNFSLYIKEEDGTKTEILSFSDFDLSYIEKINYEKVPTRKIKQNLNNIYLKISYTNTNKEDKVYEIHLNVKLNYQNSTLYKFFHHFDNDVLDSNIPDLSLPTKDNSTNDKDDDVTMTIDISFLFEMSFDDLEKKYNGKSITVDKVKYSVEYINNLILIDSVNIRLTIKLTENKIEIIKKQNNKNVENYFIKINENRTIDVSNNQSDNKLINEIVNLLKKM